ncbi:MAG TPA: TonB family protein [Pseudoxanthomonas sp.]
MVALLGLAWWWYGRQATVPAPAEPAVIEEPVAGGESAETTAGNNAASAESKRAANKSDAKPKPKPVAGITRDPAPLASNKAPKYPAQALRSGIEGSVSVRIEVDAKGVPTDIKVVERAGERSRELDRAVIDAVRNWRFEPAMKNGKPIAGAVVLPVEFKRG